MFEIIDQATLSKIVEAGVAYRVQVIGRPGGWTVVFKFEKRKFHLVTKNTKEVQVWRQFEALVSYLKSIGLIQFEVNAANFERNNIYPGKRPDRAEALKKKHAAAAYDEWFGKQIQTSIGDPRPSIAHEQVKAKFAAKADALRQRMKG